jgi:hypothetical protein
MVAPEWVVQHPTLPESKMLPIAPMGSLNIQALDRLVAFQMRHSRPRWCESRGECSTGSQATVALERARGGSRRGSSKAGH